MESSQKSLIAIIVITVIMIKIMLVLLGINISNVANLPEKAILPKILPLSPMSTPTPTLRPTPTFNKDAPFGMYSPPKIPRKDVYTIFMVGDSMTETLGPHGGKLNDFINALYQSVPGDQRIVIDNYAKGATNILGLYDAMLQKTVAGSEVFDPLLTRHFDIILIESFGYNPLSQFGIDEGLKKQTQTLDELMKVLTTIDPQSVIIFVATLAPNKETYGLEEYPGSTVTGRTILAQERMDYIQNHIAYAKSHNIPLIDIYNKTLDANGDGDISNVNPVDHIHPSFKGMDLIDQEIANFIYDNQILPK